jgi:hypothetical protein
MAGRSPVPLQKPGFPDVYERPRLSNFFNQSAGIWGSGALKTNKLFYFILIEKQNDLQPQPFNYSAYLGNSKEPQIDSLAETMRTKYQYEPGSFLELKNKLNAARFIFKLDWNLSVKNKLTLCYRYNSAARSAAGAVGSTAIRFSNNGYRLAISTHSGSIEWKSFFTNALNNRLLITLNTQQNDREIKGRPFPTITIFDGPGFINLGSNAISQVNIFKGTEISLTDVVKFTQQRHVFTAGFDFNHAKLKDILVFSYYGAYEFASLNDFLAGAAPTAYQRTVPVPEQPFGNPSNAGAKFNTTRMGIFVSDDIRVNPDLSLSIGCRIDGNSLPLGYKTDSFFNNIAKPEIEKYYDLEGALSGQAMKTHWQLSPRVGFVYTIPHPRLTIRGGAGVFAGHILNLWASGIYNVNTAFINIDPQRYGLSFNSDPFNQPGLSSLGINPDSAKGIVSLMSGKFKYPTVFRTSISVDKKLSHGWLFTGEFIFTKNIHETRYTNVNLVPPDKRSASPGSRNIYAVIAPPLIPITGSNPYSSILLLNNNKGKQGYSYSATGIINKTIGEILQINASYTYGRSVALYEPTGNANGNPDQWEQRETENGKNYAKRSTSDYDQRHRIIAGFTKRFIYLQNKLSTLISIFYEGQSGSPYSYVYNRSMINDNGRNRNTDLIYIPTASELNNMIFLPIPDYTPQQQKDLLNTFIEKDKYLRKHRGSFAERNGARLPFSHVVDIRLQQDFTIRSKKKDLQISVLYDIFNVTNLVNKNWGRTNILLFDSYPLIQFAGFSNNATLTPQYKYTPVTGKPWSLQSSTAPGSSARWISQLGFRINFN